jgi:hypothetical protein
MLSEQKVFEELMPDAAEIISSIAYAAWCVFHHAGCDEDFCVQTVGWSCIVFGGRNRLQWSAQFGFHPLRDYCTESFLDAWDKSN